MELYLAKAAFACNSFHMPKRNKHFKRPSDVNELAHRLVEESTDENRDRIPPPSKAQISLVMAELGRRGGKKGGKRRLVTMSEEERKRIARKAARARWKNKRVD